jgi:hypothetical protein
LTLKLIGIRVISKCYKIVINNNAPI